jgi:two-component system cell cycle sensor histidine kinase/response regulator CckA
MRVSENAADLIRSLLAFSRTTAVEKSRLSINDVVKQTIEMARHAISKNIDITYTPYNNPLHCFGDHVAVQSMVLNLCINAQDAMPDGGTLDIQVNKIFLKTEDWDLQFPHINNSHYIEISISDTGIGMDENILKHVFEPFFTTKDRHKGTGLGLSTVYGTINSHSGCISVNSTLKKGSTFKLFLPLEKTGAPGESSSVLPSMNTSSPPLILLVDDDENLRPIMKSLIESLGYPVVSAGSGKEALALFDRHHEHLQIVLLDLVMEHMSGREVFDQLKQRDPNINVILISGYDRGADSDYLMEAGAIAYLRKPFAMHALAELLASTLKT